MYTDMELFQKYQKFRADAEARLGMKFTHKLSREEFYKRLAKFSPDQRCSFEERMKRGFERVAEDTWTDGVQAIEAIRRGEDPPQDVLDWLEGFKPHMPKDS